MPSRSWASQLAQAAYERGWLTSSARAKSLLLVDSGLHPEQVYIGLGLLSVEQYATCVHAEWGITIERLDAEAWSVVGSYTDFRAIEGENEAGERCLFRTDVWTRSERVPEAAEVAIKDVFLSDVLRWCRQSEPVDLSVSQWLEAWSTVQATEVRLGVEQHRGVVQAGVERTYLDDGCIKPEEVPALQVWFEAGFGARDWASERMLGMESDWLVLVARHDRHPLTSMHAWRAFLQDPKGVLYLVDPDAWLRDRVKRLDALGEHSVLFQGTRPYRCEPLTPAEREVAMHGALAGAAICWIDEAGESSGHLRQLAGAGIPVTLVRGRATSHGVAWEVYTLSV